MWHLLITLLGNAAAIYAADRFIDGFAFSGDLIQLAIAALVFAVINWLVRPIVKLVSLPFLFLTFGLFVLVINAAMIWLLDLLLESVVVLNLVSLAWATLLFTVINLLIKPLKKDD